MADVFPLNEADSTAIQWLGERAYHLSQLCQQSHPVLPGFVVSSRLLREFWQQTPWTEPIFAELSEATLHLPLDDMRQLQAIAQQIRTRLLATDLSPSQRDRLSPIAHAFGNIPVILHPSLYIDPDEDDTPSTVARVHPTTRDLAALLNSQAIAQRSGTEIAGNLSIGLKRVWAELFRARSLVCWQRAGIALDRLHLAVLVQPLLPAVASGYLHLRSQSLDISASAGLPADSVDPPLAPDRYVLDAHSGQLLRQVAGQSLCTAQFDPDCQQIRVVSDDRDRPLSPQQLDDLAQHALTLRRQLGDRADLAWTIAPARADEPPRWYLTQCYPQGAAALCLPAPLPPTASRGQPLVGLPASGGQAIAPVRFLTATVPPNRDSILVVRQLDPKDALQLHNAVGLIAETGSPTSHGAILARELGIPAAVGVRNALSLLHSGQRVHLDGDRGIVQLDPADASVHPPPAPTPTALPPPRASQLTLSLSQPHLAAQLAQLPCDGVGLVRSELMARSILQGRSPVEYLQHAPAAQFVDRLSEALRAIADAFAPRPVRYRTFDGQESGRSLSLRGTLAYQDDPSVFDLELAAVARVRKEGATNLQLVLPFVRSPSEFVAARTRMQQQGLWNAPDFQCWLMAEVPSVLFLLEEYVRAGVAGIAVGIHDFTQLLLGVDRSDPEVAYAFDPLHPAVLAAIAELAKSARRLGIPCTVCADSLSGTAFLDALVRCGVTGVCVSARAVEASQWAIARAEHCWLIESSWQERDRRSP